MSHLCGSIPHTTELEKNINGDDGDTPLWCLTGIGSAVFSFRAMALSTSWADAVDATYSMSKRLKSW